MNLWRDLLAQASGLWLALQFLTRLPLPSASPPSAAALQRSPGWYPAAGLVIGAISAAVFAVSALVLPQILAALVTVGLGLLLTGALHEDGFADLCDGIGGARGDRARALAIMRDSQIGSYGALGLGMALALRICVFGLLPVWMVPPALICAAAGSRAAMTIAIAGSTYQRGQGAGAAVSGPMGAETRHLALATGLAAAVLCWPFFGFLGGLGAAAGLLLGQLAIRRIYEPRLGGWTGDCLGAVQICSEIGFLLGLMAGI